MWDYWSYCGEIESLDMMRFPDTGRFKGIVFITFKTVNRSAVSCRYGSSVSWCTRTTTVIRWLKNCSRLCRKKAIRQPWSAMG